MKNIFNHFVVSLLLVVILFAGFSFPNKAKAQLLTEDLGMIGTSIAQFFETVGQWFKEESMVWARDLLAKKLIDKIVTDTVEWIQGGGTPKFIDDWDVFLKQAGNIAFSSLTEELKISRICSPFKTSLGIVLLPVRKFPVRAECTLDKVVANINNFYADFKQGGFRALASAYEPQNNFYGQLVIGNDELSARITKEQDQASYDAAAGSGFISVQKCEGGQNQDQYCNKQCLTGQGSKSDFDQCFSNCMATKLSARELCDFSGGRMKAQTPGDTIGKAVASAVTSDTQWAANIQGWTSALLNAVINRLVEKGLNTMGATGGGNYDPNAGLRGAEISNQREFFIKDINKIMANAKSVNPVKVQTFNCAKSIIGIIGDPSQTNSTSSTSIFGVNSQINAMGCVKDALTDQQILDLNVSLAGYKAETTPPDGKLAKSLIDVVRVLPRDGRNLISAFNTYSSSTPEAQMDLIQKYYNFSDSYSAYRTDNALNDANIEKTNYCVTQMGGFNTTLNNLNSVLKKLRSPIGGGCTP